MTIKDAITILSCRDNQGAPISWQNGYVEAIDTAIEVMKSQLSAENTADEKWIPCEDLLPGAKHNLEGFLTTVKYHDERDVFISVYENGKFGHWDGHKLIPDDGVVAWMKVPEPYMGDKKK